MHQSVSDELKPGKIRAIFIRLGLAEVDRPWIDGLRWSLTAAMFSQFAGVGVPAPAQLHLGPGYRVPEAMFSLPTA